MNPDDFKESKTGKVVYDKLNDYYLFEPCDLPYKDYIPDYRNLILDTEKAVSRISKLDGLLENFSDEELTLLEKPFILKEAVLSSEIEGIHTTISDFLINEKKPEVSEKKYDILEVTNYKTALEYGINKEITEDLILEIHKILLDGVRGQDKTPGEYKRLQNYIGTKSTGLKYAKFVPASPRRTKMLIRNLIEYIKNKDEIPLIYKIALMHYQFETIHPFRDGNGRTGRILIILILMKYGLLKKPALYLSEFFSERRTEYQDRLYHVSSRGKIDEWIKFFLEAITIQSERATYFSKRLLNYRKELSKLVMENKNIKSNDKLKIIQIIELLFKNPYLDIKDVELALGITYPTAKRLVEGMVSLKMLELNEKSKKRDKLYVSNKILEILDPKHIR